MAADRTNNGVPGSDIPELTGQLNSPPPGQAPSTLAYELTPVVDDIRALASEFGIRPYRVFLVHARWTGQRRGQGELVQTSRREILPVPRVTDMSTTSEVVRPVGLTEEGSLTVDKISARYTEDDLMGRTPDLDDPEQPRTGIDDGEFWWEVVENRPSTPSSVRRIYHPSAVPALSRGGSEWKVILTKRDVDPGRYGALDRKGY